MYTGRPESNTPGNRPGGSVSNDRRDSAPGSRPGGNIYTGRPDNNRPGGSVSNDRRDSAPGSRPGGNMYTGRPESNTPGNRPGGSVSNDRRDSTPGSRPAGNMYTGRPDDYRSGSRNDRPGPNPVRLPTHPEDFRRPRMVGSYYHYDLPRYSRPFHYGYWILHTPSYSCYHSPYFYFGLRYVYGSRVVIVNVPIYTHRTVTVYESSGSYYLSQPGYSGLNAALDDIRNAWLTGRGDLMERHVDRATNVAIYLDGDYSYSLPGDDYRNMTLDAMGQISTVDFTIYKVARRSDGAYTAFARHEFYDADNNRQKVYVSYTLTRVDGDWLVVAAGSSDRKLD